ncbi:Uncharacterised protein [Bacillus freudenreichii]|nr:Uncharacterised protein [Bacillus freudenreichii]
MTTKIKSIRPFSISIDDYKEINNDLEQRQIPFEERIYSKAYVDMIQRATERKSKRKRDLDVNI